MTLDEASDAKLVGPTVISGTRNHGGGSVLHSKHHTHALSWQADAVRLKLGNVCWWETTNPWVCVTPRNHI